MNETKTLSVQPLVQTTENFLTPAECRELIDVAKLNLASSTVIGGLSGTVESSDYRTSENYDLPAEHRLTDKIYTKVSTALDIDQSRFEEIEIIKYQTGEMFKHHTDYFMGATEKKHLERGGQRVGTVIMYLNDVESGGETFFPRLRIVEQPVIGKMMYFKYDYDDDINIKTIHKGMPVESGEKWIATVWIRRYPRTEIQDNVEVSANPVINDVEYELACRVPDDARMLQLTLPGNYVFDSAVMVKITPELDSALLLYLVSALNFHQPIPYFILPIIVGNYSVEAMLTMYSTINTIRARISSEYILSTERYETGDLVNIFISKNEDRFYKFNYIFVGDFSATDIPDFLISPFSNLTQEHIAWAINKLKIGISLIRLNS